MECQSRPSIPTRFKVLILPNSLEKKAFSSTEARFKEKSVSETPGPGAYSGQKNWGVEESPSFGKRGTGYFASNSRFTILIALYRSVSDTTCIIQANHILLFSKI